MAKITKLNQELIEAELHSKNQKDMKNSAYADRYVVEINSKDAGLNVMTNWDLGLDDPKGEKWRSFVISQFNTAPNAICFVSNLCTIINSKAPYAVFSYEKQIALAIKTLRQIKIPVFLWPGVIEREIYKQKGIDIMSEVAKFLPSHKNFLLLENLSETQDKDSKSVYFDMKLQHDFIKNPYVTVEVKDYSKSSSRNVNSVISTHNSSQHTSIADIEIAIGTYQNAKFYPNLLCFGSMCALDFKKNADSVLNDSYYKVEAFKDDSERGYSVRNLQCKYSFNIDHQQDYQKLNVTSLTTSKTVTDSENGLVEQIIKYLLTETDKIDEERMQKVQVIMEGNKRKTKQKLIENTPSIDTITKKEKPKNEKVAKKSNAKKSKKNDNLVDTSSENEENINK